MAFINIDPKEINRNPVSLFGDNWALLTAGNEKKFNTMTVSWGSLGELWFRPVVSVFVRPSRHTFGFMENSEYFSLSFFDESYRAILALCGEKSGRDVDKISQTGLTWKASEQGCVYFDQAQLVLICKKLYQNDFKPEDFVSDEIPQNYNYQDFHRQYIGQIVGVLKKV